MLGLSSRGLASLRGHGLAVGLIIAVSLGAAALASAESGVTLLASQPFESIDAVTFNLKGEAVGASHFQMADGDDGQRVMHVDMAIEGGGSNLSQATLVPIAGESTPGFSEETFYRVIEQRSQARNSLGEALPLLVINHEKAQVSCYPPTTKTDLDPALGDHVSIEGPDRVVNVPIPLLFQPLVRSEVESIQFQIATCEEGPKLHTMIAERQPTIERGGRRIVEVKYRPDLGRTLSWLAGGLVPTFSFWFEEESGEYVGHRMPIHRKGPEILLVRHGFTPSAVGVESP